MVLTVADASRIGSKVYFELNYLRTKIKSGDDINMGLIKELGEIGNDKELFEFALIVKQKKVKL